MVGELFESRLFITALRLKDKTTKLYLATLGKIYLEIERQLGL